MTELTHIHRQLCLVAEVNVTLYGIFRGRTAIAVTGVHDVIVERPVVEHIEKAVPVGTSQENDMVRVNSTYGLDRPFIKRLQECIE